MTSSFDFRRRVPDGPLARFVEVIWYARGTIPYKREKIAPTGSTVAVIVLGDAIIHVANDGDEEPLRTADGFLTGPHDRPAINEPTGETFAVGIVTTPIGCEALFGRSPSGLRGSVVELDVGWPGGARLRERLVGLGEPDEMLRVTQAHLRDTCDASVAGLDRCEQAVALLVADPVRPVAEIAEQLGITHAHLDREFTRIVGLTPRALSRLLKVRKLLEQIDVNAAVPWATLAHEHGWFDQAHLIRDFKRHTGVTPSQYVAAQRAAFSSPEHPAAAGFVPEDE